MLAFKRGLGLIGQRTCQGSCRRARERPLGSTCNKHQTVTIFNSRSAVMKRAVHSNVAFVYDVEGGLDRDGDEEDEAADDDGFH